MALPRRALLVARNFSTTARLHQRISLDETAPRTHDPHTEPPKETYMSASYRLAPLMYQERNRNE